MTNSSWYSYGYINFIAQYYNPIATPTSVLTTHVISFITADCIWLRVGMLWAWPHLMIAIGIKL